MTDDPFLTHRSLPFTVAYEMLGSAAESVPIAMPTVLETFRPIERAVLVLHEVFACRTTRSPTRWASRAPPCGRSRTGLGNAWPRADPGWW